MPSFRRPQGRQRPSGKQSFVRMAAMGRLYGDTQLSSTGKAVPITGASSGMGSGMARELGAVGANLMLGARHTEPLKTVVRAVRHLIDAPVDTNELAIRPTATT